MNMYSGDITGIIISLGICVVLPIMIVWLIMRNKRNETNKRTEILLAAIEKNADIDTGALTKMMTATPNKSVKKKLLNYLLTGCFMIFVGLALILQVILMSIDADWNRINYPALTGGVICLGLGIAFLINYFVGKRMLAKEIEREENNLPEEE